MIALPKNVTLVKPGESVELPDRVFAPAPFEGLVIHDGDWFHAVTLMPFTYMVTRSTPRQVEIEPAVEGRPASGGSLAVEARLAVMETVYAVEVFEDQHNPETDTPLSDRTPAPGASEEQWDVARQKALDFLLRMKAER